MAEGGLVIQPPFFMGNPMSAKSTTRALKIKTAEVEKKEAPASTPKSSADVIFESRGPETHELVVMGIRSRRSEDQKMTFVVPAADADRFATHHHVRSGRFIRRG